MREGGLSRQVMFGALHERFVVGRRTRILSQHLATLIPVSAKVLDVGCGDGIIDRLLKQQRPDLSIQGIDVLVRPRTEIPVRMFDGVTIPFPDMTFAVSMFVDVLHHAANPFSLLKEAARVSRFILIKDHFRDGFLSGSILRFMDWVGNARHGVVLPYNYWLKSQWIQAFTELQLKVGETKSSLGLYPWPASLIFERGLHFVARLEHAEVQPLSESSRQLGGSSSG